MSKLKESINKINSLEELSEGNTAIHQFSPMSKLITTMIFLVVVISFDKYSLSGLIPFFIYPVMIMSLGEIPYSTVLTRLLMALPFSFFAALSNLFLDRAVAFSVLEIPISWGCLSFTSIIIKTILTVMAVLILIATTPMDKIANQLVRFKVPKIFVMQIMLTYRYLGLLISEASNMVTAYHLRSVKQKGISLSHAGSFMGQLLLRSFDRADKVYIAMKCRGFDGNYHFADIPKIKTKDVVYTVLLSGIFVFMRFVNISVLIGGIFN